jgi:hypothetical protein
LIEGHACCGCRPEQLPLRDALADEQPATNQATRRIVRRSVRHVGCERDVSHCHLSGERRRHHVGLDGWTEQRASPHWTDSMHYAVTFVVEEVIASAAVERVRATSEYYAVGIPKLIELMRAAGFNAIRRLDDVIYQPLIVAQSLR